MNISVWGITIMWTRWEGAKEFGSIVNKNKQQNKGANLKSSFEIQIVNSALERIGTDRSIILTQYIWLNSVRHGLKPILSIKCVY